ncbi:kinase-like protein [Acephala macrosclerotiorum]|nr:kinase-like protein [Acephala macrosclerotiorum]
MDSTAFAEVEPAVLIMQEYFPANADQIRKFSILDLKRIAELLSHPTSQWNEFWSCAPRLYCVLRLIGLESAMGKLIDEGIASDFWFPFDMRTLPDCLSPREKEEFLGAQELIINDDLYLEKDIERGKERKHVHFQSDEELPLKRLALLGKGNFGEVDKVESTVSHRVYARKKTPRGLIFLKPGAEMAAFERERNAMMKLRHRHCIDFIGSYTTPNYLGLLISPVAEMNLEGFLSEKLAAFPGRDSLLREFFGCLSRAFRYLHEETKIRHRDVKPANILIYDGVVKIADFGLSLDWTGGHSTTTKGTCPGWSKRYCAPEVAQFRPRNSSSDIWSLGCVFLEIITVLKKETVGGCLDFLGSYGMESSGGGRPPYHSRPQAIAAWTQRLVAISDEDNEPVDWVAKMLDHVRIERPTAAQLVEYTCYGRKADGRLYCGKCCAEGTH